VTTAAEDLDRAITAEHKSLRACHDTDCQDRHLDLVLDYEAAQKILAAENPDPADKRRALAILYTARSSLGATS